MRIQVNLRFCQHTRKFIIIGRISFSGQTPGYVFLLLRSKHIIFKLQALPLNRKGPTNIGKHLIIQVDTYIIYLLCLHPFLNNTALLTEKGCGEAHVGKDKQLSGKNG